MVDQVRGFYSPKKVLDLLGGISRTTLWREVRAGRFPAPIQITPGRKGFDCETADEAITAIKQKAKEAGNAKAA